MTQNTATSIRNTIDQIRAELADKMLSIFIVICLPALAASLYRMTSTGWHAVMAFQIAAFVYLTFLFIVRKKVSYRLKIYSIFIIFGILTVLGTITYGIAGGGTRFFIIMPVFATLFFGLKGGIVTLLIGEVFIAYMTVATTRGWIIYNVDFNVYNMSISSWITTGILTGLLTVVASFVVDRLYVSLSRSLQESNEKNIILQNEITERQNAEIALKRKAGFDEAMTAILNRFALASTEEIEPAILDSLGRIAILTGADHSFIISFEDDYSTWRIEYSCVKTSSGFVKGEFFEYPFGTIPWCEEQIGLGSILIINRLEEFPEIAEKDFAFHKNEGAKSVLCIPISHVKDRITGCIGLHAHKTEIIWADESISYLKMAGDAISAIIEKKKTDEALRSSEQKARAILDRSFEFIGLMTPDGTLIDANNSALQFAGIKLEDVTGKPFWETPWWAHSREIQETLKSAIKRCARGDFIRFETSHSDPGGNLHYIDFSLKAVKDDSGKVILLIPEGRDITQIKIAEEALRKSEERLMEAQRIAHIGSWEHDLVMNRLIWSDEVFRIFEIRKEDFGSTYEDFIDYVHPDDRKYVNASYTASIKNHEHYAITHRLLMSDGRIKYVYEQCETYFDNDGKPLRSLGTVQDVTELKHAQDEKDKLAASIQQAQKMESLGTLAAGVAHDFNNILTGILGFTELAGFKLEKNETDELPEYLAQIKSGGMRARDLIKQIMAFTRQSGVMREPLEIIPIIRDTIKFLRASLPATIEIKCSIPEENFIIRTDSTQFHQILMNLCSNSAYAMPVKGGIIEISITRVDIDDISGKQFSGLVAGSYLRLVVSDTGNGISPEILPKIFDPFFTTKERDKGTGMGLSVVHGIVSDLEGNISVYSRPGKGTSFQILLPLVDEKSATTSAITTVFTKGSGTVLLVDDEELILMSGSGILKELGYDVVTAAKGTDAVELFRASPDRFCCVITDMSMPGMTGLAVAEQLNRIRPGIPILLATGFSPGITSQLLDSAGIHEMVMKPLIASELSEAIERIIHKSSD